MPPTAGRMKSDLFLIISRASHFNHLLSKYPEALILIIKFKKFVLSAATSVD